MNSTRILNYKNIKRNKYFYNIPHKTTHGSYVSSCVYKLTKNDSIPFYFESPKLKTTSGIYKENNIYYIDLELNVNGNDSFYNFVRDNDDINIMSSYNNCKDWFGKVIPLDIIKEYYKSPLIINNNGSNPILKVRIPSYRGKIMIEIFNDEKELIDPSYIDKDDDLISIIEFSGIQFLNKMFLGEYDMQKIRIFKKTNYKQMQSGYIFSDKTSIDVNKLPHTINIQDSEQEQDLEPITEPISEPITEPVTEPTPEPVTEPTPEPVTEPTPEPVTEPTPEPVTEPTPEPFTEPTPEPVTEPTPEPVTEPTPEPITEPVTEPVKNENENYLKQVFITKNKILANDTDNLINIKKESNENSVDAKCVEKNAEKCENDNDNKHENENENENEYDIDTDEFLNDIQEIKLETKPNPNSYLVKELSKKSKELDNLKLEINKLKEQIENIK